MSQERNLSLITEGVATFCFVVAKIATCSVCIWPGHFSLTLVYTQAAVCILLYLLGVSQLT